MPSRKQVPIHPRLLDLEISWLRSLAAAGKSPRTIETHRSNLERFYAHLAPDGNPAHCTTTIDQVSQKVCEEYLIASMESGHAMNTVRGRYNALQVFLSWCVEEDELTQHPMARLHRPVAPIETVPILSDEQIRALLSTCERGKSFIDRRDYAILRTFLATGMRRAELTDLQMADIDLVTGVVHIRQGKGGEGRFAAIGPKCISAIDRYLRSRATHKHAASPALWLCQRGAIRPGTIDWVVRQRGRDAGIPEHIHCHLFRHHYAHEYLESGGGEVSLTALAGWSSLDMVKKRYGKALQNERAVHEHHRLGIGEKW